MAQNGNDSNDNWLGDTVQLKAKQKRAIAALLVTRSVADAASTAGIGKRTLDRWLSEPRFRAELALAQEALIDGASRRLVGYVGKALTVIDEVMSNEATSAAVRLRAAQTILENMIRLRELRDLEQRIAFLEAYVQQQD